MAFLPMRGPERRQGRGRRGRQRALPGQQDGRPAGGHGVSWEGLTTAVTSPLAPYTPHDQAKDRAWEGRSPKCGFLGSRV